MQLSPQQIKRQNKKSPTGDFFYILSGPIAPTGHTAAHVPHEIHFDASITHLPSAPMLIAPTGQIPIHVPQPIHFVLSILYAIFSPLFLVTIKQT